MWAVFSLFKETRPQRVFLSVFHLWSALDVSSEIDHALQWLVYLEPISTFSLIAPYLLQGFCHFHFQFPKTTCLLQQLLIWAVHLLFIAFPQLVGVENGLYLKVELDVASGSFVKHVEALRPPKFKLCKIPPSMHDAFVQSRWNLFKQRHNFVIFAKGEAAQLHLVYAVNVELREKLHVVVDMRLVTLKHLPSHHARTQ